MTDLSVSSGASDRDANPGDDGSRSALKEWAAIEQLLGSGEFVLLLRKGGLWEKRDGFEIEHRRFWIFPTLYHQNPSELRPEFAPALDAAAAAHRGPDEVRLEHFAEVTDAFRVESLDALRAVADQQALTLPTIESRFQYRNRPYLHALVLRVHRLPDPVVIPNTLDYEGCVSWVELDDPLAPTAARPVLDAARFEEARRRVLDRLGEAGVRV